MTVTYRKYDKRELVSDWESLLQLPREEVALLSVSWQQTEVFNADLKSQFLAEKESQLNTIKASLTAAGVPFVKKNGGGHLAWFKVNVISVLYQGLENVPSRPLGYVGGKKVNGLLLYNGVSPISLIDLYDSLHCQYRTKASEKEEFNKLLIKSVSYAERKGIDITNMDQEAIIKKVDYEGKLEFLAENPRENKTIFGVSGDVVNGYYYE